MKRTERDLQKYYEECRQIMNNLGFDAKRIPISLNGRLSSTLGRYFRAEKRIEISKDYFLNADEHFVKNTIIHEICHQVCKEGGHGREWKRIANYVSLRTPYKIERLANTEEIGYSSNKKQREKKYAVRCTRCSEEWRYVTKTNAYRNPKNYICPHCNERNTLISVDL